MALEALIKLGTEPIAGDNPAGEDIQFDDDFDLIRQEIGKMDSVTGEEVDWSEIIDKSQLILAGKSKNIQVASYLCLGLFRRDGFDGLKTGLTICHDLLANYWETMYPPLKRKRGRIETFVWLGERGGKVSTDLGASQSDLEILKSIVEISDKIEALLREKLAGDAVGLGDLGRDQKQKVKDLEAKIKAAEARAKAKAAAATAGAPELDSVDEANKAMGQLRQNAKNIAEFFRKADPVDPFAYRFMRAVNFCSITALPPNKDGVTQIPAPQADIVKRLDEGLEKKEYAAVIETAEMRFASSIFWLDLQRYVLLAMEAGGDKYKYAREAIFDELAMFLKRQPEIIELQFANQTPFASPETVKLLETVAAAAGQAGTPSLGGGGGSDGSDDRLTETLREARKLGKKKLPAAIALLQEGIAQTGEKRGQFIWRLELARMCLDVGQMQLAVPQLEYLGDQIDEHNLEQWEPQLCREVFSILYLAQKRLAKTARAQNPELAAKMQKLLARLCRLDAAAALAIDAKK